ncbi:hypothetical protein ACF0H5_023345 [Mactra antiquata]
MGSCNCQRFLAVLVVVLAVIVVVLAAILGWRLTREDKVETKITVESLNKTYPLYFKNQAQNFFYQQQYLNGFNNRTIVNATIPSTETCTFSCNLSSEYPMRKKRSTQVHHGCCVSSVTFTAPTKMKDIFGTLKTFLQLDSVKQYFPEHVCQTTSGCTGCVCAQENSLYSAVVLKSGVTKAEELDDTEIDFFYFTGCCKCINN